MPKRLAFSKYTLGWICALPLELAAALLALDEIHESPAIPLKDNSTYHFGRVQQHNVVIVCLPSSRTGTNNAALVARDMMRTFPIDLVLVVGIAGGVPSQQHDIRLGDVVVAQPQEDHGGVVQYDFGRFLEDGTLHTSRWLNRPPARVLSILAGMLAREMIDNFNIDQQIELLVQKAPRFARPDSRIHPDRLFKSGSRHIGSPSGGCDACDPTKLERRAPRPTKQIQVHHETILSGNTLMRNAVERDRYLEQFPDAMCFEMESSGLYEDSPCIVIRGICDYADTHKEKSWQNFAALTAATYAKQIIVDLNPTTPEFSSETNDLISSIAAFEEMQPCGGSLRALSLIPSKLSNFSRWFWDVAAVQLTSEQSVHHKVMGDVRSDKLKKGSYDVNSDTDFNEIVLRRPTLSSSMPLSMAAYITSSTSSVYARNCSIDEQDTIHPKEFLDLQKQALDVLRNAVLQYVENSRAYALLRLWVNTVRKIPLPVSMLLSDNITFVDANNSQHSLPLEYFRGWTTFNAMIHDQFKTHPGFHKVKSYQYSISVAGCPNSVLDSRSWNTIKPRTKITMDILFPNLTIEMSSCPLCGKSLRRGTDSNWKCSFCQISYCSGDYPRHEADALSLHVFASQSASLRDADTQLLRVPELHSQKLVAILPDDMGLPGLYASSRLRNRMVSPAQGETPLIKSASFIRPQEDVPINQHISQNQQSVLLRLQAEPSQTPPEDDLLDGSQPQDVERMYQETGQVSSLKLFRRARLYEGSILYKACLSGDLSHVSRLLQDCPLVDEARGPWGTCLTAAVLSGTAQIVYELILHDANPILAVGPLGFPLRAAALHDRHKLLMILLRAAKQHLHRRLVDYGVYSQSVRESLRVATTYGRLKSIRCFLSFNVSPFQVASNGSTPFLDSIRLFEYEALALFTDKAHQLGVLEEIEYRYIKWSATLSSQARRDGFMERMLTDLRSTDAQLAHCITEVSLGRGRILQL